MATPKQEKAMKLKLENPTAPMRKIMRMAGYSEDSARYPKRLTESKGWKELLNKYFPDDRLLQVHNELLESKDQRVKREALDMAYKLKDKYPATKTKVQGLFGNIIKNE